MVMVLRKEIQHLNNGQHFLNPEQNSIAAVYNTRVHESNCHLGYHKPITFTGTFQQMHDNLFEMLSKSNGLASEKFFVNKK